MHATTLGLPEALLLRLRIALKLQAGNGYRVRIANAVSPQTDLVLVDASIASAMSKLLARLRKTRVVMVFGDSDGTTDDGIQVIARNKPLTELQPLLRGVLDGIGQRRSKQAEGPVQADPGALIQIAGIAANSELDCPNLRLSRGDTSILLRRWASRVLGRSFSEILNAADHLNQPGWRLERVHQTEVSLPTDWVSRSLDGFLIRAIRSGESTLPAFADTPVRLKDWPDLGGVDDALALKVAGLLCSRPWTASALARECSAPAARISALLWAFKAGRLLQTAESDSAPAPAAKPPQSRQEAVNNGLLARLARKFGLQGYAS